VKNTRREFLTGLTKVAGGAMLGYAALPLLAAAPTMIGCEPTSVPLEPEQPTTPVGANGEVAVNISALTQGDPALMVPNLLGSDSFGVIVTLTPDGLVHAFSMKCTHQGCSVSSQLQNTLNDGEVIVCPCHDSMFRLDGSVAQGPATLPLTSYPVLPDPPVGGIANIKII
jgi:Rieske Fe-S protein